MQVIQIVGLLWVVLAAPVWADDVRPYGTPARYALRSVVYYPDLRVVYRGERIITEPTGAVVHRDFDISTDCTVISVSLAPGQDAAEFDAAIGTYVLEVGGTRERTAALKPDELIVWEKPAFSRALAARTTAPTRP